MRRKLDMTKLAQLPTANEMLDKKYGAEGTESRATFDAKSKDWYGLRVLKCSQYVFCK